MKNPELVKCWVAAARESGNAVLALDLAYDKGSYLYQASYRNTDQISEKAKHHETACHEQESGIQGRYGQDKQILFYGNEKAGQSGKRIRRCPLL